MKKDEPDRPAGPPSPETTPKDFEVIGTIRGVRALADPVRLQMVQMLTRGAQTGSMLARALDIPANRAHYHLQRLLEAGLIQDQGGERERPTEERYYVATARHILVDPGLGAPDSRTTAALRQSIDTTFLDWRRSQILDMDWGFLARLAVHRSLQVKPGEQVLILFAPITLEAAEAILVEVEACGGIAHLRPWSRNFILRTIDTRTPEQLDGLALVPPEVDGPLSAVVFLTSSLVQGAPPNETQRELLPRLLRAVSTWKESVRTRGLRYLNVGLPHRAEFGPDFLGPESGINTYWNCVAADLGEIRARGERLLEIIRVEPEITIIGKNGEECRITLDPSHAGISDGTISAEDLAAGHSTASLPAGAFVALPVPGTGDGVFEADYTYSGGRHFRRLRVTLQAGRIVEVEGPEGADAIRGRLAAETGDPGVLAAVTIGLNSGGKGPTGRPELDSLLTGVITLDFGNNELLGGTVRSTFNLALPAEGLSVRSATRPLVVRGRLNQQELPSPRGKEATR